MSRVLPFYDRHKGVTKIATKWLDTNSTLDGKSGKIRRVRGNFRVVLERAVTVDAFRAR